MPSIACICPARTRNFAPCSRNAAPFKEYGARFLVRAGRFETVEGGSRARNAVIEFPSYQAALDCWRSPGYQKALKLRQPVSTIDLIVIEGYEPPAAT